VSRRHRRVAGRDRPVLVHLTTTDMSLDWLLGPQLVAYADAGFEVIGMSAPGAHVEALEGLGVRHVALDALTRSNKPTQDLAAFGQISRELRRLRPDILHTHNPKPGILGRIAGRITRVPLVVNTQHGLYAQPDDRRRRRWPVYAAERLAASFGDLELVQNPEDVDTLVGPLHVPDEKVRLLGNGVDLERFDPAGVDTGARARLRAEWGVTDDESLCLMVGRLVREKGVVELLEAAHLLHQRGVKARLVVVGPVEPDKSDAIDSATIERALAEGVVMTGTRTDMPECYAAADVFVTASWREGIPRSAMEAAVMGLPAVATDIRGNRQVVVDEETGFLVPVRDAQSLSAALERLTDVSLRKRLATKARRRAIVEFDQQRVIDRTLDAYSLLS
jgi:glycosyltransferase involved in cell wall biosynthesis